MHCPLSQEVADGVTSSPYSPSGGEQRVEAFP
jgi:hypothetical protein